MDIEATLAGHNVSEEDLEKAKSYQSRAGGSLEKILLNMGSFSEELLPSIYAQITESSVLSVDDRDAWVPPAEHRSTAASPRSLRSRTTPTYHRGGAGASTLYLCR